MSSDTSVKLNTAGKLHFFVILLSVLMAMLDRGSPYRFFAYLNLVIVLVFFIKKYKEFNFFRDRTLLYILLIPFAFIALHLFAVLNLSYIKEFQRIILVTFTVVGLWVQAKVNAEFIQENIFKLSLLALFLYVLAQIVAIWFLKRPFGTTSNPHFLAFYSASCLLFTVFAFFKIPSSRRWLLLIPFLFLAYFVLLSSSRPTWIGLIFSGFLVITFTNHEVKKHFVLLMILVLSVLFLTNVANFSGRFVELMMHINKEERTFIWQDAWRMQMDSSIVQWIFGHGLHEFVNEFKFYSQYHIKGIDFKTPHNFMLEVLYTSGVIGMTLAIALLCYIYKKILLMIKLSVDYKDVALLLLALLTTNLIAVGITESFYSGFNLTMIAIVSGVIFFIYENNIKSV